MADAAQRSGKHWQQTREERPGGSSLRELLADLPEVAVLDDIQAEDKTKQQPIAKSRESKYNSDVNEKKNRTATEYFKYATEFVPGHLAADAAFVHQARTHQWKNRREVGYAYQASIFEFIKDVYGPWLGRGMTQADLAAVDRPAYTAFRNRVYSAGERPPPDLVLPSLKEARLDGLEDPRAKEALKTARRYKRAQMRDLRRRQETCAGAKRTGSGFSP